MLHNNVQQWQVRDADDMEKWFQGTAEECDRWCRENHMKSTLWCEINPETQSPMTIKDMLVDEG